MGEMLGPEGRRTAFDRQLADDIDRYLTRLTMGAGVEPLFERALRVKSATAWVTANDDLALMAMAFLARRRRRVPEDIALVGFDDSLLAFGNGLTSYNMNMPGVATLLVRSVVEPMPTMSVGRGAWYEVPGMLALRQSTASSR